ncbi:hypothetical protein GCM10020221_24840 [Streptomyces thioluteus]|uniref:SnoaL-like domain-containing protein n=1 Tax=Streptomyces thioluteus TaxID=66431 RepID=A0ABN3WU48_STRTU
MAGDTALVTCTENILSSAPAEAEGELGPLVGQLVVATNTFRRVGSEWKVWSHHGSPVLAGREDEEYERERARRPGRGSGTPRRDGFVATSFEPLAGAGMGARTPVGRPRAGPAAPVAGRPADHRHGHPRTGSVGARR